MSENDTDGPGSGGGTGSGEPGPEGELQAAPADARRRHADLSLDITEADHRYYVLDSPTHFGIDYDAEMRELRLLSAAKFPLMNREIFSGKLFR